MQLAQRLPGKIPLSFCKLLAVRFAPSPPSWQRGGQHELLKPVRGDGVAGGSRHRFQGDWESNNLVFLTGDFKQEMHTIPSGSSLSQDLMGQRSDAVH